MKFGESTFLSKVITILNKKDKINKILFIKI